jgi:hypothetical protein
MAEQHDAARDAAVEALATQLGRYEQSDPTFNGFVATALSELKAVDRAPLIERAFSAGAVDIDIMGDWDDAQIELGLLGERMTPRPPFEFFGPLPRHAPPAAALAAHRTYAASAKRKAHRKMEKASRRENRRRKK